MKQFICRSAFLGICTLFGFTGALFAAVQEDNTFAGTRIKAEYLGTRVVQEMEDLSLVYDQGLCLRVKEGSKASILNSQLSRSAAYNPAAQFLREGLNFEAVSFANVAQFNTIPPDVNGAVGETQYIYALNQGIHSFDKKTGLPDGVIDSTLGGFFGRAAADPHILYDKFACAWYLCGQVRNTAGTAVEIILAVCPDSTITKCSKWDIYLIPNAALMPGVVGGFVDFPLLSYDIHAVYLTVNIFNAGSTFLGGDVTVFQKSSLLAGDPNVTIFTGITGPGNYPDTFYGATLVPAQNYDKNAQYGYIINTIGATFAVPLVVYEMPFFRIENPGSTTPSLIGPIFVPVPPQSYPFFAVPHKGNLFPAQNNLASVGPGIDFAHVRNGQLYTVTVSVYDSSGTIVDVGDRVGYQWLQFDLSGDSTGYCHNVETPLTVPAVIQNGHVYDPAPVNPLSFTYPSCMTNKRGDLICQSTVVGKNEYTNIAYQARKKKDPKNTLRDLVYVTNNNSNAYNFGPFNAQFGQRWGDYTTIFVDPCNELNFWLTGEYAGLPNAWSVQVIELIPVN
jgi:hypothetical protein